MVNSMVERATSSMLIGPDWAMNTEICDMCNHDPAQAKAVVKGIKKRLGSKNPKAQLLALTLLETIMKNCGDFVHMHVAERDLLHEMVKIVKKKPDFHVKEKILTLIDTWQETFGGARARYPQYYAAYHELLRLGAVFPQRSERSAPVLTSRQPQTLTSDQNNPENGNGAAESSAEAEFPTLSLTELQNARGIMDVLAEMLTAIDPEKKEGLRQEVIVDLVEQCRTNKQRVVHLVNSTSDESLLCQGLALNDDLQRVLAKHESLVSGTPIPSEKPKPETSQALVPVNAPLIDTGDTKQHGSNSGAGFEAQLLAITSITTNGPSEAPAKVNPKFDLLSGDDFSTPNAENSLALVPAGEPAKPEPQPVPQSNALALVDMLPQNNVPNVPTSQTYSSSPQFQQTQKFPSHQHSIYPNASVPNMVAPQYEHQDPYTQGPSPIWNGLVPQQPPQQESPSPVYGAPTSDGLPPPPWEAESPDDNQSGNPQFPHPRGLQPMAETNNQGTSMYMQPPITGGHLPPLSNQPIYPQQQFHPQQIMGMIPPQQIQPAQMPHMYSQPMAQQLYPNQMPQPYGYSAANGFGYGYGPQPNAQFLDQRMSGLSVRDNGFLNTTVYTGPSMANASYVHVPSGKPTKPEDKLFGDLVDFAKIKPNKMTPGRAGSM